MFTELVSKTALAEAVAMLPTCARAQRATQAYNSIWRVMTDDVLRHIAANGGATVIALGYVKAGDVMRCEEQARGVLIEGARFRTWVSAEMAAGMPLSACEGESSKWEER